MSRSTIDFGIDLGTTNSAIALVAGAGTEIVKNNLDSDVTPSAVYINRAGNLWVGQSARAKLGDERTEDDLYLEFKRRLGTGYQYHFRSSARIMEAEDLSAEVLKSLRGDVAHKKGEEITAAVITVPAAFELPQCEATKIAAQRAGFQHVVLLQEPVAAALAYGFQRTEARSYWLVFDFGGGTFDAAVIRSEHGTMSVVNHGGDNFLGGSDIDWAIVSDLLVPRVVKEFRPVGFRRGSPQYRNDLIRLKAAAETAKIELSRRESTFLDVTLYQVGLKPMSFETEVTRADLARVAAPIITKAVNITRRVLAEKQLTPAAIERAVLVGGPTLAPYFRDLVAQQLGIPADFDVDPLTVVARGAAIFAGTQPLPSANGRASATPRRCAIELIHKPVGVEPDPLVGGKVVLQDGAAPTGFTVEIVNQHSKWRSGRVALSPAGAFQTSVRAEPGLRNTFQLELRDGSGNRCEIDPDTFHYTIGAVVDEQPIINNVGIATADNRVSVHFTKGQGLPAKSTRTYRTALAMPRGSAGSLLRIPIVEGNHPLADRNLLIGTLDISAANLKRDLPAGGEVEVTFSMDSSRLLHVVAYVPLLDEEFPTRIELGGRPRQPDRLQLGKGFNLERGRLEQLLANPAVAADQELAGQVKGLQVSDTLREIGVVVGQDQTDFDRLLKAERSLLELRVQTDELVERAAWPVLLWECETALKELQDLVARHSLADEARRVERFRDDVRSLARNRDRVHLEGKRDEIRRAVESIQFRQSSFWVEHFEKLAAYEPYYADQAKARPLVARGRDCAARGDIAELQNVIYDLQNLLPPEPDPAATRGYGSGVVGH